MVRDFSDSEVELVPAGPQGVEALHASVRRWRRIAAAGCLIPVVVCIIALATPWPRWWVAAYPWSTELPQSGERSKVGSEAVSLVSGCTVLGDTINSPSTAQICCGTFGGFTATAQCSPYCFPGHASVQVHGRGSTPIAELREGDRVLVGRAGGWPAYEPVLGFLHAAQGAPGKQSGFITVMHAHGEFRASAAHIVFVAGAGRSDKQVAELVQGDRLILAGSNSSQVETSVVLSVSSDTTELGMFAPLTRAGTVVVDDILASQYASPVPRLGLPHEAAHAAFFPLRVYHKLGLSAVLAPVWARTKQGDNDELHPFAQFLFHHLRTDQLLKFMAAN